MFALPGRICPERLPQALPCFIDTMTQLTSCMVSVPSLLHLAQHWRVTLRDPTTRNACNGLLLGYCGFTEDEMKVALATLGGVLAA